MAQAVLGLSRIIDSRNKSHDISLMIKDWDKMNRNLFEYGRQLCIDGIPCKRKTYTTDSEWAEIERGYSYEYTKQAIQDEKTK